MEMDRRRFLSVASAAGVSLLAARPSLGASGGPAAEGQAYKYRLAFDVWINDVRDEAMPLQNWPYGVLDDKTVDGIVRALDVQAKVGYTAIDICGLFTTYAWPVDIKNAVDAARMRRVKQIINAAHERSMKVICFPSGVLNWGFDDIIKSNPKLETDNKHEMNPLVEQSWEWQHKVYDYVIDNYEIDGFHLEAADQGRCSTPECLEKWPNNVGYFCYVTRRAAEYLRHKDPNLILTTTIQGFGPWGIPFTEQEKDYLVNLSESVDCLFDQGHRGTYIPLEEWKEFIPRLHCAYGTSGGIWIYPPQRWERTRWFLPYTQRTGRSMKELYEAGGRGVMYYQGPVRNPSTEVNIAFGGQLMANVGMSNEDALAVVLEQLYHPQKTAAHQALTEIFRRAENIYFSQWNDKRIHEAQKLPPPGELHLTNLFGASPGAATYLMEPFLDTEGRLKYKQGLVSIFRDISKIENNLRDGGRIARIKYGIAETLVDINNIARCKGEKQVWDDENVGKEF